MPGDRYDRSGLAYERGLAVTGPNVRIFFLTIGIVALLVLAFLLAAPAFAG